MSFERLQRPSQGVFLLRLQFFWDSFQMHLDHNQAVTEDK